jgi:hypothetical protein
MSILISLATKGWGASCHIAQVATVIEWLIEGGRFKGVKHTINRKRVAVREKRDKGEAACHTIVDKVNIVLISAAVPHKRIT